MHSLTNLLARKGNLNMTRTDIEQISNELREHVNKVDLHHYKLALPEPLYDRLQRLARQENTSVVELIRRSIKLGLLVADIEMEPGAELILRRPGMPDQRLFFI